MGEGWRERGRESERANERASEGEREGEKKGAGRHGVSYLRWLCCYESAAVAGNSRRLSNVLVTGRKLLE